MNKKNFKLWTDALRSGKYEQGSCLLRSAMKRFCCLGVACEVAEIGYQGGNEYPPEELYDWLGIDSMQSSFERRCVHMNDTDAMSFSAISEAIDSFVENGGRWDDESDVEK